MTRRILFSASALAALLAGGAHAQDPSCPRGRDDGQGIGMSVSLAAHPTRAAQMVDSVLVQGGYIVRASPAGEGEWEVAPRFSFVEGLNPATMSGVDHPGVRLSVSAQARGDSVRIEVGAHTVCRTIRDGKADEEAESAIELVHAMMIVSALTERAEALEGAGTDLAAAVERSGGEAADDDGPSLQIPQEVGAFRVIGQHRYDDPAAGVNIRYGKEDGGYVDIYLYPGTPPECDAACGARHVNEEVDGYVGSFDEMVQRGYFDRMKLTTDETLPVPAGAPWLFGRHLVMDVELRGQAQESHYFLYAFQGFKVKARATFPPGAGMSGGEVRAFVDALLPLLLGES